MTNKSKTPLAYKLLYTFIIVVPMVMLFHLEAKNETAKKLDLRHGGFWPNGTGDLVFAGSIMATGVGSVLTWAAIDVKRKERNNIPL